LSRAPLFAVLMGLAVGAALWTGCGEGPEEPGRTPDAPPDGKTQEGTMEDVVDLAGLDVLLVVASKGFRDEEFQEPATLLAKDKAGVFVASSTKDACVGMLGHKVTPDLLLSEVDVPKYAAVLFVGGSGASEYFDDPTAHRIACDAAAQGKLVGAICIAPSTLANAGLLKGKKATSYASEKDNLVAKGAEFVEEGVVRDGKIITADGPESARAFAKAVCAALAEGRPPKEESDVFKPRNGHVPRDRPPGP